MARRFGESAADSIAVLGGVNTVGALVACFFVVFMLANVGANPPGDYYMPEFDPASETVGAPVKALNTAQVLQLQQQQQRQQQQQQTAVDPSRETLGGLPDDYNGGSVQSADSRHAAVSQPGDGEGGKGEAECCACDGESGGSQKAQALAGRNNLSTAALVLGGLMMAGNHVPQIMKLWKTKDAQSFSGLSLFFQVVLPDGSGEAEQRARVLTGGPAQQIDGSQAESGGVWKMTGALAEPRRSLRRSRGASQQERLVLVPAAVVAQISLWLRVRKARRSVAFRTPARNPSGCLGPPAQTACAPAQAARVACVLGWAPLRKDPRSENEYSSGSRRGRRHRLGCMCASARSLNPEA